MIPKLEEALQIAYEQVLTNVKAMLLTKINGLPPEEVEDRLTLLLEQLGYGIQSMGTMTITKKDNLGGMHLLGSRDPLGVEKIMIQFTRARDPIRSVDIEKLENTRVQTNARQAVFMTTSDFDPGAKEEAKRLHIELIDGERLASLMIKHEIGVNCLSLDVPSIDEAFFHVP